MKILHREERIHLARAKSLILGVLVGSAVGAGVTLLSTPSSGKGIRFKVKQQAEEWKHLADTLREDGFRLKDQLAQTSKEGAILFKELTQEMKESVEDWKETVEPHQENINEYLSQIESSLKELEEKVKK